jgi:riboflavin synthase
MALGLDRPRAQGEDVRMFTGIVEELGTFMGREGGRARFSARAVLADAGLGDSIAVSGCCLTLVDQGDGWWEADLSDETLSRTTLGGLAPGDPVNLERPLRLADRLGGHLVQGHVDSVGTVVEPSPDLQVTVPPELLRFCVEKGSITVDGVSLTIVDVLADSVTFAIIPHTADITTLGQLQPGGRVNLETDVMAKHVEQLLLPYLDRLAKPG